MGLEYHQRRRKRNGQFAPEAWDDAGPVRVDVHLMMDRETAKELRQRAPEARLELGQYVERILIHAWARWGRSDYLDKAVLHPVRPSDQG